MLSGETSKNKHLSTGKLGEDLACNYLIRDGYRIVDRNYRLKIGEIDIVAMSKDKTLVFVEVKTMQESGNPAIAELMPEDNLTKAKLEKLSRACELFVGRNPELVSDRNGWRIDLVAVSLNQNLKPEFKHYENLF